MGDINHDKKIKETEQNRDVCGVKDLPLGRVPNNDDDDERL